LANAEVTMPSGRRESEFARAKATSSLPGAGIGLFVVRRLVQAMGGRVTVANRPEGGAAFTVTLPRYVEPAES
jgi:two-component system, OmpR family, sensor histidine kinase KdpD